MCHHDRLFMIDQQQQIDNYRNGENQVQDGQIQRIFSSLFLSTSRLMAFSHNTIVCPARLWREKSGTQKQGGYGRRATVKLTSPYGSWFTMFSGDRVL